MISKQGRARLKRDGTRAETRFGLWEKRTSPFKLAREGGGQFSRLLAAEVCASAVVMVVMLDTSCSEVECKTTGYPLHSHVSPSLPLPCVTVCRQVSTELYLGMSLMHLGISETPVYVGNFKWSWLRMNLENSLRSLKTDLSTTSTSKRSTSSRKVNWCEGLKENTFWDGLVFIKSRAQWSAP